ncbi:MAG: signal peptide peptidase SppA [Myxococcota bacterium]|jgi:protease-4
MNSIPFLPSARLLIPLLLVSSLAACSLGGAPAVEVLDGSTLVIELGGNYIEAPAPSVLGRLTGDQTEPFLGLLSMFTRAERDDRIANVVIRIQPLGLGWGKADEVRAAILRLRAAGRRTVAHIEVQGFAANKELYIASAADEIFVTPGSTLPLVGLAAEYIFFGGLWDKLGIDFDVAKAGRYKSAVEVYTEKGMSEDARAMADSLLDDTYERFVAALADGRKLSIAEVEAAIDTGAVRNQQLESLGLIDGESHLDELLSRLDAPILWHGEYASVDPEEIGFEAEIEIALIYGTGPVVQGGDSRSLLSGESVFASATVSRAIVDAAEDPDIAAIILRIDSPGGSALASEIIWRAISRAKEAGKPVIASMSDVAASGGYYVASAADVIVADPGTLTGSIGVFAIRPVLGGLFEKLDIGIESVTRGRHADFLLSSEKLSPAALARLQTSVSDTYQLFLSRVAAGRNMEIEDVDAVGQGRVWTGAQALEVGLVDELGGIHIAARRAKIAIGLDPETDVFLVPYPRQATFQEQLFDALSSVSVSALQPTFELPEPLGELAHWARVLPTGSPLLVPPMMIEIR